MWSLEDFFSLITQLQPEFRIVVSLLVVVAIVIEYKILSRSISSIGKRLEVSPHVQNSLRLILRIATMFVGTAIIFVIYGLPATLFLSGSAFIGAAVGFGSSKTINNIVAGFYVILSRSFEVKDYVKIGDVEGQVEEITINYTKLYTPTFHLLSVPNVQVMDSQILNYAHEGFIKYTFSLTFPHSISNLDIVEKCIKPAIEEFHKKHQDKQLRKPEYYFETSTHLGRSFKMRIFVPRGEAKILYSLQPEFSDMILNRWDMERKRQGL